MNNDFKDEYTNEGDREEQIKEEKENKTVNIVRIIIFIFILIVFCLISFQFFKHIGKF